ncbi:TonB-dependent receptor [Sphingomonas sp.]|uniref:TonB-dependent receptor domain-containing protein n=1 Tax=Sphingomonas sp. TaxID=28214 RepID=UPI001EC673C9|nr:TonB-dependent receptor [Sphingomonas sp.]MBX3595226.1 TonB-dependent receptor [Sphingomonas sp.]
MARPLQLASVFLFTTALVAPSMAHAAPQDTPGAAQQTDQPDAAEPAGAQPADGGQQDVEISAPGAGIVVTGRRETNVSRTQPQVVTVLTTEDIARTGEGDIAGSLGRATGLSVVGNGYVYVRGLGDRYSLALLNGSPLPSPEPLKRVVPLDLFPTSIISSSLVQKSYSANYPGEFGGGVINLTTKSAPREAFLTLGGSLGYDSATTGQLGYTYYGADDDWTGFDNGTRTLKPSLRAYLNSGQRISSGNVDTSVIAADLVTSRNALVQRNTDIPANWSFDATGGFSTDIGATRIGVIATAGLSNKWRTRDTIQQTAASRDLSIKELDFRRVITDQRAVANALLGINAKFDQNVVRLTGLFIRDTLKQARLGQGTRQTGDPNATYMQQDTAWFERQLIDLQGVAELQLTPELSVNLRGGYANTRRNAPDELSFEYYRSNRAADPYGQLFINRLNNGQQGRGEVSYSYLNENLWSAGADLSYRFSPAITAVVGYAYADTDRRTERRDFQFTASNTFPTYLALLRPDMLLSRGVIAYGQDSRNPTPYTIGVTDTNEANPVFDAALTNHAGYAQALVKLTDAVRLDLGVRYETARQTVTPVQVFTVPTASLAGTALNRDYWLPAATLTWEIADRMQFRVSGSKTIARPQFRELIFQSYFDPDNNRMFRGNPRLVDSQLYNGEARLEWYFAREQRVSIAGFYKKIDKPIETYASFSDNDVLSSFANAPRAQLWGGEIELVKYINLDGLGESGFFSTRRLVVIGNYTYTQSKIIVRSGDTVDAFPLAASQASDFFTNGAPLTGQSNHLANLQVGIEDTGKLSQMTFLLNYASERVTNRGAAGQPDIKEHPGFRLDFVARQGINILGTETELKLEVRNITGASYQEYQESGANRIYYNRYKVGRTIALGINFNF